jgi:hypothetical protein
MPCSCAVFNSCILSDVCRCSQDFVFCREVRPGWQAVPLPGTSNKQPADVQFTPYASSNVCRLCVLQEVRLGSYAPSHLQTTGMLTCT